ncbi:MAG: hypothetical protein J0J06_01170 [Sphingomonas sp.]|uniref:hypothetical protein n=1 Tax=Sphingomonas sp. TaxID=28214 RepID=UPI001AD5BD34|nr:hypothetical protein [Sphingomonas sp.]MBN8814039.1 hypothetical protein [Sphingomonas sp.]
MPARPVSSQYETSIDRVGLAIGAGGLMGGAIGVLLMAFAGTHNAAALLAGLLIGSLMTALSITALAAIPWALLHASGRRGPMAAAVLGAAIGFALFLGGQTYGYGLFTMPATDAGALLYRWASGFLTSLVMAAMAAGVAVVMWRVAYRKVG